MLAGFIDLLDVQYLSLAAGVVVSTKDISKTLQISIFLYTEYSRPS